MGQAAQEELFPTVLRMKLALQSAQLEPELQVLQLDEQARQLEFPPKEKKPEMH